MKALKPFELTFQAFILVFSIWALGWSSLYIESVVGWNFWKFDFYIYYEGARGNYIFGWIYRHYVRWIFFWMSFFNIRSAYFIWGGIQTISFMVLTHFLFKVRYGWLAILASLWGFKANLQGGNIDVLLAMAYVFPVGTLLGTLVKPHHALFALLYAAVGRDTKASH